MINTNGFFGQLQGPFNANIDLFSQIQEECSNPINYITKLGIQYVGDFYLDLEGNREGQQIFIEINGLDFQLGKTRMLEFQDVQIYSIKFKQDINENCFIDYQYK